VRALGLVDAEEMDGAVLVREGDADVVAVDGIGPVGDAIRVDLGQGMLANWFISMRSNATRRTLHPRTPIDDE
jgi:hypothetical protein